MTLPTEAQIADAVRHVSADASGHPPGGGGNIMWDHGTLLLVLLRDVARLNDRMRDIEIRQRALEFPGTPDPDTTEREERGE
jgi:hypothetical protein